jgi:hypothetical protein
MGIRLVLVLILEPILLVAIVLLSILVVRFEPLLVVPVIAALMSYDPGPLNAHSSQKTSPESFERLAAAEPLAETLGQRIELVTVHRISPSPPGRLAALLPYSTPHFSRATPFPGILILVTSSDDVSYVKHT